MKRLPLLTILFFACLLCGSSLFAASNGAAKSEFVYIPAASYLMGDSFGDGDDDASPAHTIKLSAFSLGRYDVTLKQFREFAEASGYKTTGELLGSSWADDGRGEWGDSSGRSWKASSFDLQDDYPVVCVSWYDAIAYCNWRSKKEGLKPCYTIADNDDFGSWRLRWNVETHEDVECDWKANGYRLPTEAEWEYAAKGGGKAKKYSWLEGKPNANISDESAKKLYPRMNVWAGYNDGYPRLSPVGSFPPNELGIYDIVGNVWQWCWDWYNGKYYSSSEKQDPRGGDQTTGGRIIRGGSWSSGTTNLRVDFRGGDFPAIRIDSLGFRLVRNGK